MPQAVSQKKKNFNDIHTSADDPLRNALTVAAMADKTLTDLDRQPEMFDGILNLICNGVSLIKVSQKLGVPYSRLSVWLNNTEDRRARVTAAMIARDEYLIAQIIDELRAIGMHNVKELFNDDGTMKKLSEIPDELMACVSGIEIDEYWDKENGRTGTVKKVKMIDKLRGIEMLTKAMQGFVERKSLTVEHTFKVQSFDVDERLKIIRGAPTAEIKEILDVTDVRPVDAGESQDL